MGKITIWNAWSRDAETRDLINPFRIILKDASKKEVLRMTGLTANTSIVSGPESFTLTAPTVARYVRIQLDEHKDHLHLAEIQAFAA